MGRRLMLSGGEEGVLNPRSARNFFAKTKTLAGKGDQDAVLLNPAAKLVGVADGLGGGKDGDLAAEIMLSTLDFFMDIPSHAEFGNEINDRMVRDAVRHVMMRLVELIPYDERADRRKGMGTTFAVMKELPFPDADGRRVLGAWHLGDSMNIVVAPSGDVKYVSVSHSNYRVPAHLLRGAVNLYHSSNGNYLAHPVSKEKAFIENAARAAGLQVDGFWDDLVRYFVANNCDLNIILDFLSFFHPRKQILEAAVSTGYRYNDCLSYQEISEDLARVVCFDLVPVKKGDRCFSVTDGADLLSVGEKAFEVAMPFAIDKVMDCLLETAVDRAWCVVNKHDFEVEFGWPNASKDQRMKIEFPGTAKRVGKKGKRLFVPDHMSIAGFEVV